MAAKRRGPGQRDGKWGMNNYDEQKDKCQFILIFPSSPPYIATFPLLYNYFFHISFVAVVLFFFFFSSFFFGGGWGVQRRVRSPFCMLESRNYSLS